MTELTLEPPDASGANAGRPQLDEDYLILSTIHSAKGQEWQAVYVLNLVDGCIPSDMATAKSAQIEEERRLLYVAMTRAKEHLYLIQPLRFFRTQQHRFGNGHISSASIAVSTAPRAMCRRRSMQRAPTCQRASVRTPPTIRSTRLQHPSRSWR